jgi:hypothetical protein
MKKKWPGMDMYFRPRVLRYVAPFSSYARRKAAVLKALLAEVEEYRQRQVVFHKYCRWERSVSPQQKSVRTRAHARMDTAHPGQNEGDHTGIFVRTGTFLTGILY